MEWIYLEELTDEKVTYRYYPENGEDFGIVSINRKTGQRFHDMPCPGVASLYAGQAWHRLDEYNRKSNFPEKALVAWC